MDIRSKAAMRLGGGVFAVTAAIGGYIAIDGQDLPDPRTGEDHSGQSCEELVAQAADAQAKLIEQLGADAPNFDFNFPESCFD